MRKFVLSVLFVSSLGCLGPTCSLAGDWETYLEVNKRFYFLDDKEFTGITCGVDVPAIGNILRQTKEQLRQLQANVSIEENLDDFQLTFDPVNGLSFIKPEINAKILSKEGLPDQERAKQGVALINDGFKQQIDGVVLIINSIFELYLSPNKEKTHLISITGENDPVGIRYSREGITVEAVIDGANIRETGHGNNLEAKSETKCVKIRDKYLVEEIKLEMDMLSTRSDTHMKISYQDVSDIVFPMKIVTQQRAVMDNVKQEATIELLFTDCKMK